MWYRLNEGAIQFEGKWTDRSINSFVLGDPDKNPEASLVITRHHEADKTLAVFADEQLVIAAQRLPRYQLISRGAAMVNGLAAMQTRYRWETDDKEAIDQWQAAIQQKGFFLIVTLTARAPGAPAMEAFWQETLGTIRWDSRGANAGRPTRGTGD